jgi:hypothetical protein
MTLPYAVPDWLPWWVPLVLLIPAVLYALVLLAVPFNVFGLKGRLDSIEARLDDIQGDLRMMALRLPEAISASAYEDTEYTPLAARGGRAREPELERPPIPPAHYTSYTGGAPAEPPRGRREPRFDPPPR